VLETWVLRHVPIGIILLLFHSFLDLSMMTFFVIKLGPGGGVVSASERLFERLSHLLFKQVRVLPNLILVVPHFPQLL